MRNTLILTLLLWFPSAWADFGWRPKKEALFLSGGFDYLYSDSNFRNDSLIETLQVAGQDAPYTEAKIWIEPEYGLSEQWSARMRLNFVSNSVVNAAGNGYVGSSIGDILLGLKLALGKGTFSVVGDLTLSIPTYSQLSAGPGDLLPGNSTFDIGLGSHFSLNNKKFFAVFSPELIFRSSGFAPLLKTKLSAGMRFQPAYFYGFLHFQTGLSDSLGYDTTATNHNVNGAGGSYALISGSPALFELGVKAGIRMTKALYLEAQGAKSVWGKSAPDYFRFGVNLMYMMDFEKADTRPRIHEIPFDAPHEEPEEPAPYAPTPSPTPAP